MFQDFSGRMPRVSDAARYYEARPGGLKLEASSDVMRVSCGTGAFNRTNCSFFLLRGAAIGTRTLVRPAVAAARIGGGFW
jgi:hypothetical protein